MAKEPFRIHLFLPAQAAAETEAMISSWKVKEGDAFQKGQDLAEIESAKSIFTFEAPCAGRVEKIFFQVGKSLRYTDAIMEIETSDESMQKEIPPAGWQELDTPAKLEVPEKKDRTILETISHLGKRSLFDKVSIVGIGGYVPERVVTNAELLRNMPDVTEEYIFGVTGIRERHWAAPEEKPSDLAYKASMMAISNSQIPIKEIDGIVLTTTTPDVSMPSTACILQGMLGIRGAPAFDLNAACSGWLYGLSIAKGMIFSEVAHNVLVVGIDMQSRLLDKNDKSTYFLFGDGAGAAVLSSAKSGHVMKEEILVADAKGLHMARRDYPGFLIPDKNADVDPWVRMDGHAIFRFATESFASLITNIIEKSEWEANDVKWIIPHQANGRILKASAQKCGIPFERFYLNIDHMGNTSSASIPLALLEVQNKIHKGDKIIFCSVGAGITAAAISMEW